MATLVETFGLDQVNSVAIVNDASRIIAPLWFFVSLLYVSALLVESLWYTDGPGQFTTNPAMSSGVQN